MVVSKRRVLAAAFLLTAFALAGCFGDEDGPAEGPDDNGDHGEDDHGHEPEFARELAFAADVTNGTVPINITFTADVFLVEVSHDDHGDNDTMDQNETMSDQDVMPGNETGNGTMMFSIDPSTTLRPAVPVGFQPGNETGGNETDPAVMTGTGNGTVDGSGHVAGNFTWVLLSGDGREATGTQADFPLTNTTLYSTAGNFTPLLTVTFEDGEIIEANLTLTLSLGDDIGGDDLEPPQASFEFGPGLGCVNDPGTCIGIEVAHNGGGVRTIDGVFIPLDERYWGVEFTTTVSNARADSDCFLLDEDFNVLGDMNNVELPCGGIMPTGVSWLFLASYAEPHLGMTAEFFF